MGPGKAFELLVKQLLLNIGFTEINSDGLYVFDGTAGQMIQGLGEAHNADVLLEPPVQTPFYAYTRILIECKDYTRRVGLNTVRSVLGLREDINHFDIVDKRELEARRVQRRRGLTYNFTRYYYQVALASMSGYTIPAQKFAATHRIPLLEFNKLPFWEEFCSIIHNRDMYGYSSFRRQADGTCYELGHMIDSISNRIAIAITNSGQMLFLYRVNNEINQFADDYSLHWQDRNSLWSLVSGNTEYQFQLPNSIMELWLNSSVNELDMKRNAINCKAEFFSNMVIYYQLYGRSQIKMISIDREKLIEAQERL